MTAPVLVNEILNLQINKDNKVFTDSLAIAKVFKKEHYNVLRDIEALPDFNERIVALKIELKYYTASNGKPNKMYLLDRDTFTLVVMSFTGGDAFEWKKSYIAGFNIMESIIVEQHEQIPKLQIDVQTKAIAEKDKLLEQLRDVRRTVNTYNINGVEFSSARGVSQLKGFSEKKFKLGMQKVNLVNQKFKRSSYWEATDEGLNNNLISIDAMGTPLYAIEACADLFEQYKNLIKE